MAVPGAGGVLETELGDEVAGVVVDAFREADWAVALRGVGLVDADGVGAEEGAVRGDAEGVGGGVEGWGYGEERAGGALDVAAGGFGDLGVGEGGVGGVGDVGVEGERVAWWILQWMSFPVPGKSSIKRMMVGVSRGRFS